MRSTAYKSALIKAGLAASVLLRASGASFAKQGGLTAAGTPTPFPDGSVVPMWGYSCSAAAVAHATCASLTATAAVGTWSPLVIAVRPGNLAISLTTSLPAAVPETSLVIVGQLGGGLGTTASSVASPAHATQSTTWPIAGDATGPQNVPPPQGNRVQSFSTPVLPGATTALNWVGLKPGTYLIESGTHPSIQGPMGLYGILVVTTAPAGTTAGCAYPGATAGTCAVTYNAEIPLLLSEIDPVQNAAVAKAVTLSGFSETKVWSGLPGGCGNPATTNSGNCYPPAVNYTPLYYLFNGVAFDSKSSATSASYSLFAPLASTAATPITGSVLVRFVNAGLRMHVPSIVGSLTTPVVVPTGTTAVAAPGFSLVAEDGNPLPGVSRVQSEVFLAAGKTYDVMVNVPTAAGATALPVYDRELSLSANAIARDAGMVAYISVNGSGLPAAPAFAGAIARPDTYNSVLAGQTLTVSDPAKGVIANDTNVFGVQLVGTVAGLTLNPNGTFTYLGPPTSFTYCANGAVSAGGWVSHITPSVTHCGAPPVGGGGAPHGAHTHTPHAPHPPPQPPPILAVDRDAAGYPLSVAPASAVASSGLTLSVDKTGAFNASVTTAGTYTFTYKAQNSQGTVSAG